MGGVSPSKGSGMASTPDGWMGLWDRALLRLAEATEATYGVFYLKGGEAWVCVAQYGLPFSSSLDLPKGVLEGMIGDDPKPRLVGRKPDENFPFPIVGSFLLLPLGKGEVRAVVLLGRGTGQPRFSEGDLEKAAFLLWGLEPFLGDGMERGEDEKKRSTGLYHQILAFVSVILEVRDPYTFGHSERVALLSEILASKVPLSWEERDVIYRSALLHDIGKVVLPDYLLLKPGPLTPGEWEAMKKHPLIGERVLATIRECHPCALLVRHHHERWDGKGYPDGLKEEEIPLGARIIALADGLDAMSSERPYREALPPEKVREELEKGRGTQWDPYLVSLALSDLDELLTVAVTWRGKLEDVAKEMDELRRRLSRIPLLATAMAQLPVWVPQHGPPENGLEEMVTTVEGLLDEEFRVWLLKGTEVLWGREELPSGYWENPSYRVIPIRNDYRLVVKLGVEWAEEMSLLHYALASLMAQRLEHGLVLKELEECRLQSQGESGSANA